ncbi:MAG: hydrolase [Pirellula sp.]|jgi:glutamate carboxypeptidase|nr:hydrolase [Pirellula sp.]
MSKMELEGWLSANAAQMADDLERLCNVSSGSDDLAGLRHMEELLVEYFEPLGVPCQRIPLPDFEVMDDFGVARLQSTSRAIRWDMVGAKASTRKKLLLSIHYDTVYGPESSFQGCERYQSDGEQRMRGPGVIDAKGGIVILKWTAMAAKQYLDLSEVGLSIVLTPDEEIGSPASIDLWRRIAQEYGFAMLYEPTMADGSMVSHRKGTGTYIAIVRGRSAHSGRNFSAGRNAILHASRLAVRLDGLNGVREGVTVNVGRIRGGDAVNVVPDLCVLRANVRVNDHSDYEWIRQQIEKIRAEMDLPSEGFRVEISGGVHSAPKVMDASTQGWMQALERIGKDLGQSIQWNGSGGASDGNKLAQLGLPNIDTFGPEGDLLHSDQEWVSIASLPKKVRLGVAMIEQWACVLEK